MSDRHGDTATYDSVAYQTTLAQTHTNIKSVLVRRLLDPLRYIVSIDASLPMLRAAQHPPAADRL